MPAKWKPVVKNWAALICAGSIRSMRTKPSHKQNRRNGRAGGTFSLQQLRGLDMGFGKGALLWLIGIPLPIILLLALFMHH